MSEKLDKQEQIKPKRDDKGRLLPGNTANPNGRPKGKTMKEFVREFLMNQTDEEKIAWLKDLPKDTQWKMAEGNPSNNTDITTGGDKLNEISHEQAIAIINRNASSTTESSE